MNIFMLTVVFFSALFLKNFGIINFFSKTELIKTPTKFIKVLLHELPDGATVQLNTAKGFSVFEYNKKSKNCGSRLNISYKKNLIIINNIHYKTPITIKADDSLIEFNKKRYQGTLILKPAGQKAFLINRLNLEDYVSSVVKTESWPGWPLEINKVLAIVCRTYALSMVEKAEKINGPYHVTNTNLFQTYNGVHTNTNIGKAVNETQGMIILYEKKPILAMYDSCCGGIIPAQVTGFDFSKKPYLARSYACKYCKGCTLYKWQTVMPTNIFAKKLTTKVLPIHSIKVTKKDKAGIVQKVTLKGKGLSTTVTGKKIYSLSKEIKSFCFDAYKKSNNIVFFGRGYGHHIGLCQWGAYEMTKKGYGFKKILSYYYPGISLGKII